MARGEPLFRQWQLLKTLQANRFGLSGDDLAGRLGYSKRTVQRDLGVLQHVGFPISFEQRDFGKRFWKLIPHFIESEKLQLTVVEMLSLFLSQQLLSPLAGTPFGDGLASALQKIKAILPTRVLDYFADLEGAFLIKSLGQQDYSGKGKEIAILNDAILHQRVLRITYHSTTRNRELTTTFHPYGMVLLSASLYCIGWLEEYGEVRTLKASRFLGVQRAEDTFDKPATFSLAKHTYGAFGIFGPGRFQTIRARFTGWAAINVREHRWHQSQKIVSDTKKGVTAEFELSNTVEFKRWLLGFGRHAVLVKPKKLAKEIAEELAAARGAYR
ncbi:MAG: transcriptional regulator [Phycisphaerae bacterium]|nr:transcriptional regulator [Phycisphaerae bacterium]